MSRLIKRLRAKQSDTKFTETSPTKPTKKTSTRKRDKRKQAIPDEATFARVLDTFLETRDSVNKLNETKDKMRDDLVEYTQTHGAKDQKGNYILQAGNNVATVTSSEQRELNLDKVDRLLSKLIKRRFIRKKEATKVLYPEYKFKLTQSQYNSLREHLEEHAVIVERDLKVNETELELLVAKGVAKLEEVTQCYDKKPPKVQFRPSRIE